MLNQKFTFCFKITIKWNLTKLHATRLKSAKYKTHEMKDQILKQMIYNKMNQMAYHMMKLCSLAINFVFTHSDLKMTSFTKLGSIVATTLN